MKKILLNAQFYVLLALFSLLAIPVLTLTVAVGSLFVSRRSTMRRFRRAISWYGWVVVHVLPFPWIRVRCRELAIDPKQGPCLFVCNHRSASDAFLLSVLPVEGVQVVNIWPFRLPVFGFFGPRAGYLSVREMPVDAFFERAGALLRDGVSIGAFPEGTRSRDGKVGPFHGTVFRLALQTRCTLVPLCIVGNERRPPKGSLILDPGEIVIRQLPPIPWEQYKDCTAFQLKTKIRDAIIVALDEMEGRALRTF